MPTEILHATNVGKHAQLLLHDICNCLIPITGYSEAIIKELDNISSLPQQQTEQLRRMAAMIQESGRKTTFLLEELSTCLEHQEERKSPQDLNHILSGLSSMLTGIAGLSINLVIDCHPDPLPINANRLLLERMIINLVVNAKESIDQPGCITIQTGVAPHPFGTGPAGARYATISISDDGCGIRESDLGHLFERSYTTKSKKNISGLGLASAKLIMDNHDGFIIARNNTAQGATFTAYLPLLETNRGKTARG